MRFKLSNMLKQIARPIRKLTQIKKRKKRIIKSLKTHKWLYLSAIVLELSCPTKSDRKYTTSVRNSLEGLYDTSTVSGWLQMEIQLAEQTFPVKHPYWYALYTYINDTLTCLQNLF